MDASCMNNEIVLNSLDDVVKYINNIEGEFIINVSCDDSIKKGERDGKWMKSSIYKVVWW